MQSIIPPMNKHLNIGTMRNKFVISVLSLLFLTSCFKDKGNYDYTELAEITIENIPEVIEVLASSDHITINPKVTSSIEGEITDDNSNFEFSYKMEKSTNGYLGQTPWVDLNPAKTLNLDTLASFPANTYIGVFTVKDLRTEIETVKTFQVKVSSSTYEGWMILCNEGEEERVRMDMISVISSDRIVAAYDILSPLGLPNVHHARGIGFHPSLYASTGVQIYVMSEEGTYLLNAETFETDESWNIYYVNFIIPPTNEHIVEYVPLFNSNFVSARANFCVSMEGNAYAQIMGMAGAAFENPINTSSRGGAPEYKVAPYVGVSMARPGNSNSALFYDVDNRRFVGWRYNSTSDEANQLLASLETEEAPRFSWTTGMDLVYMESTRYSNGLVYAILQDESGKRVVYGINMSGNAFVQEAVYDNLNAPDFDKATTFAFHSQYPFMFYGVGNKVYLHNLGMNRTYEMTNIALDANEEVTMLKFNLYQYGDLTLLNNQTDEFMARQFELMVGSYDPSTGDNNGGRLGFYMVNPDNSVEKRTEYSGFAKIVDVVYRERI